MKYSLAITFTAILTVLAAATFIEQSYGSSFATHNIYHSAWFIGLWALLALLSAVIIVRRHLWQRLAVFALHAAFLLILTGAATTFLTSKSGMLHIREGYTENTFRDDSRHHMQQLPFSVRLDSFRIQYYPGTETPSDYISHVTIIPGAAGSRPGAHDSRLISMNNILHRDGYRLYQSSYDEDGKGTVLTVRYDPAGTAITYTGYALMAVSMIWILCARKERFRRLLRKVMAAGTPAACTLMCCIYGTAPAQAHTLPTVNKEKAGQMARRQIVYNGRMVPFSTMAHDFIMKIYGKPSYHGLSAEQVACGWMARPEAWKDEPMIRIKNTSLRHELGAEGEYVSLQSLFNADGSYKVASLPTLPTPHSSLQTPHSSLPTPSKALQELDEKVGIIIMLTQGTLFTQVPEGTAPLSDMRVEAEIIYNNLPVIKLLFMLNLAVGLLSLIFYAVRGSGSRIVDIAVRLIFHASFAVLICFYALRWYVSGHIPLGNGYETMLFMALVIMLASAVIGRRFPQMRGTGMLLSGFTLLVAHLSDGNPQITNLMPVLNSPLLSLHVSVVMTAYALLGLTFIIAAIYFMEQGLGRFIGHKSRAGGSRPSFRAPSPITCLLLYPAVFLLATGIFIGAIWANVSWGAYWSWDPKEVWALITMLVYSIPLHVKALHASDRRLQAFMLLAFLTVLMTYFGVNFFLGGMHSYA